MGRDKRSILCITAAPASRRCTVNMLIIKRPRHQIGVSVGKKNDAALKRSQQDRDDGLEPVWDVRYLGCLLAVGSGPSHAGVILLSCTGRKRSREQSWGCVRWIYQFSIHLSKSIERMYDIVLETYQHVNPVMIVETELIAGQRWRR